MKALVEFIARSLVDHPQMVEVKQVDGEQSIIVELKVAPEDMGKVIGAGWIAAMRTIVTPGGETNKGSGEIIDKRAEVPAFVQIAVMVPMDYYRIAYIANTLE